jgi:hypothetical protein
MRGDSDAQVVHFINDPILMQNVDKLEAKISYYNTKKAAPALIP